MSTNASIAGTVVSGVTEATGTRGGRGRGRGRGGGGGRGRGGPSMRQARTNTAFKGSTPEMNGHVFECYEEQGNRRQYSKTLEALEGYLKKTCKFPEDLSPMFADEMRKPAIERPDDPAPDATETDKVIWQEEIRDYMKRTRELRSNFATMYAITWGQCSEAMRAKIKSTTMYNESTGTNDCYWLLKQIKSVTLQFDEAKYGFVSIMDARASFLNCRQGQYQTAEDYLEQLRGWVDAIECHGGTVSEGYELISELSPSGKTRTVDERKRLARDCTLAAAVIRGADQTRYGTLTTGLANQYAMGKNDYPTDMTAAYSMLVNYRTPANQRPRGTGLTNTPTSTIPEASALTFAQAGTVAGADGTTHTGITCYNCQSMGHYASQCPQHVSKNPEEVSTATTTSRTTTGTTLVQYAYMMAQSDAAQLNPNWILLDSQSTISVFNNKDMLTNVRPGPHVLRAITNGGFQDSNWIGDFPNLGPVWYNRESIANILSLSAVRKVCRVTMDTSAEPSILVYRKDGSIMRFVEEPSGLYVFKAPRKNVAGNATAYTMVSTVAEHKTMFSRRQIEAADAARALYRKIGRPDEAEFQNILQRNFIRNCPVTADDAKRALLIYGPDIAVLKGKMTRRAAAPRVPTFEAVTLPLSILKHQRNITLCLDIFFVQNMPFIHTISREIGFRTASMIPDRKVGTFLREVNAVVSLYHTRGFVICDIHADTMSAKLSGPSAPLKNAFVRAFTDFHKRLPKLLIQHMVADAVRCLNAFPWKNGVSNTMSPATIVTGVGHPDFHRMRLELGTYVQVFEDCNPSNTPRARSLGAIALTPTGNAQGDYHFLSLATGARISRHAWTEVPITDTAIARVEALAFLEGQPLIQDRGLVVEWRHDQDIDDYAYDADYPDDRAGCPPQR